MVEFIKPFLVINTRYSHVQRNVFTNVTPELMDDNHLNIHDAKTIPRIGNKVGSIEMIILLSNDQTITELRLPGWVDTCVGDDVIQFVNAADARQGFSTELGGVHQ